MKNLIKTVFAGAALIAAAGTASATESFEATFAYNPNATFEETYKDFERTARSACRIDLRRAGGLVAKRKVEKACRADLMNKVIDATESAALSAYHAQQTGTSQRGQTRRILAGRW
ncbi:MAG: hypothetical protein AAFR00_02480 [Pseudomonadota bacterium]